MSNLLDYLPCYFIVEAQLLWIFVGTPLPMNFNPQRIIKFVFNYRHFVIHKLSTKLCFCEPLKNEHSLIFAISLTKFKWFQSIRHMSLQELICSDLIDRSETNSTIEFRNVDLQKACINLLLTTLCLPLHFKDLTIRGEISHSISIPITC